MLEKLYKYHKDWVELAKLFDNNFAEDIVQEMYILMHKYGKEDKIFTNDKPNKGYIYIAIRNIYLQQIQNPKSKITKVEIDDNLLNVPDDFDINTELEWYDFRTKCEAEVNSWHQYDKKLFTLYRDSGMSMRKIAEETGISFVSIFHTLKANKKILKNKFENDYERIKKKR